MNRPEVLRNSSREVKMAPTFEGQMADFSLQLDRENKEIKAKDFLEFGKILEQDVITPNQLETFNNCMIQMVEHQGKNDVMEPLIGAVFTTGVNDGIGMMVLLPAESKYSLGSIRLDQVVHGTPALVQFQDKELVAKWDKLSYGEKVSEATRVMKAKAETIKNDEAKMNINWGGWGSLPWYLMHRQQLTQEGVDEQGKSYDLSVSLGFLGSAFTLNKDYLKENPRGYDKLRLGQFVVQIESALEKVGELIGGKEAAQSTIEELSPDLIGHSMGAYLAVKAAKSSIDGCPIIESLRRNQQSNFVADKPVIMGAAYEGEKPAWMDVVLNSVYYKEQVQLQVGVKGMFVKLGVQDWWDIPSLASIRETIGPSPVSPVRLLFKSFLTPERMWDGGTIYPAHLYNYFWDRAYHELCVNLLDSADPVVQTKTLLRERREPSQNLRVLMGDGDKILGHELTNLMVAVMNMPKENFLWRDGVAHHANLEEIQWMMHIDRLKKR